jgi:hypothetical protein
VDIPTTFHTCTAGIYQNFFNLLLSDKILKAALPIIAIGWAGEYIYLKWLDHKNVDLCTKGYTRGYLDAIDYCATQILGLVAGCAFVISLPYLEKAFAYTPPIKN